MAITTIMNAKKTLGLLSRRNLARIIKRMQAKKEMGEMSLTIYMTIKGIIQKSLIQKLIITAIPDPL